MINKFVTVVCFCIGIFIGHVVSDAIFAAPANPAPTGAQNAVDDAFKDYIKQLATAQLTSPTPNAQVFYTQLTAARATHTALWNYAGATPPAPPPPAPVPAPVMKEKK